MIDGRTSLHAFPFLTGLQTILSTKNEALEWSGLSYYEGLMRISVIVLLSILSFSSVYAKECNTQIEAHLKKEFNSKSKNYIYKKTKTVTNIQFFERIQYKQYEIGYRLKFSVEETIEDADSEYIEYTTKEDHAGAITVNPRTCEILDWIY